jgi:II/X family phage/plasmid replication protein
MQFYNDESVYLSGSTSTLKIYNKFLEFKKHDLKRLAKTNFDLNNYIDTIKGFVRFECEIYKRKFLDYFKIKDNKLLVNNVKYENLKEIWGVEFMKLLNFAGNDLNIVRGREAVLKRLQTLYKPSLVNTLYNFYSSIMLNGENDVKKFMSKTTYYRNKKYLLDAGIDISQTYKVEEISIYNFNPFNSKEVA